MSEKDFKVVIIEVFQLSIYGCPWKKWTNWNLQQWNIYRGTQQKFELKNVIAEVKSQWIGSTGEWKLKRE